MVEETYGLPMETHNAFIMLVGAIEAKVREHVSESTLERIWGYSTREASSISVRTLNVLSQYVGFPSWKGFCAHLKETSPRESEEFSADGILAHNLTPCALIKAGWLPDRIVTLRYLGEHRFEVVASENSSLQPGDSFECLHLQPGRPLYLDRFRRKGADKETRYVAGERSGLTLLELKHN